MRGLFVTFEGTEGAGKSTQVQLLAAALEAHGRRVTVSREPGGTGFGRLLRGILLDPAGAAIGPHAELFLYLADRAQHVREVLLPALEQGSCVICDRFSDATIAYQVHGRGLDEELVRTGNRHAAAGLAPDLTVLLEFDQVEDGIARARARQAGDGTAGIADRFEREEIAFHRRVREGYRRLAEAEPGRFLVLPASITAEELHARILPPVAAAIAALDSGIGD